MAKPSRGGKIKKPDILTPPAPNTPQGAPTLQMNVPVQQVTPPTLQQISQGNVLPSGGTPFDQFQNMTDDQQADVITQALGQALPVFLDDSGLQKLAYYTGLNTTPTIMTETQLAQVKGPDIWRSVKNTYNPQTDIGFTSKDIYNQVATGAFTQYSDSGGSAHGKAIYFDVHKGSYGVGKGYTVMHAKILPSARTISERSLDAAWAKEQASGSKLARAISHADRSSQKMIYAMAKGYDAVVDSQFSNYRMIINRRALALSDTTF